MSTSKRVLDCSHVKSALKKSSASEAPEDRPLKRVSFSGQASTKPPMGRHDGTKISVSRFGSGDVVPSPVSRTNSMDNREKSPSLPFLKGVQFQTASNHSGTKSGKGSKQTVLPTYLSDKNGPAIERAWRGIIEVESVYCDRTRLSVEMTAHLSAKVSRKAYDFSKKINPKLLFKLFPRIECYPRIFQDSCPNRDDIALYFYPAKVDAKVDRPKGKYSDLLRDMRYKDLMMQSRIDDIELLMFPSTILPADSQQIGGHLFMWGVFRRAKDEI